MAFQYKEQVKYVTPEIDELLKERAQIEFKSKIKKYYCHTLNPRTRDYIEISLLILHIVFFLLALFSLFINSGHTTIIILFVITYLFLSLFLFLAHWSSKAKDVNIKIEKIDQKLEYQKSHLSDKIKVQYDDGEVYFYKDYEYVSDGESCLLVPDGTIYHYYMGCFIHWKPEQQKTVLDKGWLFVDKKRAIEEGFKECKLCAENIKPDKEKYERMLASPEHEVFKLIGSSGEECQDNLRLFYNDPEGYVGTMLTCNNVSTNEDKEKWQIYDKYGILRVGSLPKKIIDYYPYYMGRAYIFIKEIIEDEDGFLTAYCYIDMRHHSYKMWRLV